MTAGITIALTVALVWPVVFGIYIAPKYDHELKVNFPPDLDPDNDSTLRATPASVSVGTGYSLTGTGAQYWGVGFCAPGNASPGSTWVCTFSMQNFEACTTGFFGTSCPSATIDQIQTVGANQTSLIPSLPQSVVGGGNSITFVLEIAVPSSGESSISLHAVIDSH
ncbi:MAG: hypothetical protein ACHQ2Y_01380 [Candidatus Lutacidiplasmatales archaeon]